MINKKGAKKENKKGDEKEPNKKGDKTGDNRKQKGDKADTATNKKGQDRPKPAQQSLGYEAPVLKASQASRHSCKSRGIQQSFTANQVGKTRKAEQQHFVAAG